MTEGQTPEAAVPAQEAAPAQADQSVLDADLPQGDTFPRDYVEKLRQEAAGYRVKLKDYEPWDKLRSDYGEVFGSPDDLRGFLDQFKTQDSAAEYALKVLHAAGLPVDRLFAEQKQSQEDDPNTPVTRAELQQLFTQQQQAARQASEDAEVEQALSKMEVPDEAKRFVLAAAMTESAHLGYAERLRRGFDQYRKALDAHASSLTQKEEENRQKTPGSLGGGPALPGEEKAPADWGEASKRARARLEGAARADTLS